MRIAHRLAHAIDFLVCKVPGGIAALQGKIHRPTDEDIREALESECEIGDLVHVSRSLDMDALHRKAARFLSFEADLNAVPWAVIVSTVQGMMNDESGGMAQDMKIYFEHAAKIYATGWIGRSGSVSILDSMAKKYGVSRQTITRRAAKMPEVIARLALSGIYCDVELGKT